MNIKCLHNSQENFYKEHRSIYLVGEMLEGLSKAGEGLGKLFEAAGKLVEVGTKVADRAAGAISKGFDVTEVLVGKAMDKIQGGTLKNLPEYDELGNIFTAPAATGNIEFNANEKFNSLTGYDIRLACLELRVHQLQDFYKPLLNECDYVEEMIKRSKSMDMDKEKRKLKEQIRRRKLALKKVPSGTREYNDIENGLDDDIEDLKALESLSSDSPERPTPQIQEKEFPPGSGKFISRWVFDSSRPVKLDLKRYKDFLKKSVSWYFERLEVYNDEISKISYYKEKLIIAGRTEFTPPEKKASDKNKEIIMKRLETAKTRASSTGTTKDFKWFNK